MSDDRTQSLAKRQSEQGSMPSRQLAVVGDDAPLVRRSEGGQPRRVRASISAITLETFQDVLDFAQSACRSTMVPTAFRNKPEDCAVAVMFGAELGLPPIQSLQSIAVINGRPSVWGDAVPGLCWASGKVEDIEEFFEGTEGTDAFQAVCIAKRRGASPKTGTFSQADAKKAGLFGQATHGKYPKRMMQWRARHFALHDAFPDVLRGIGTVELEMEDAIEAPSWDLPKPDRSWFDRKPLSLTDGWDNTWFEGLVKKLVGETNAWKWLGLLIESLVDAPTARDVEEIAELPIVQQTIEAAPPDALETITKAFEAARVRTAAKKAEPVVETQRQPAADTKVSENPIQSQTTEPKPDPSAGNSRQAETSTPASSVGESQSRVAPNVPSAGSGQPTTIDTVEIWACEDSGEPLDRPEPFTAIEFANWFASALFRSKSPDALMEHNADAIGEAGSDDKARTVITDAIARHRKGVAEASEKTAPPTQTPVAEPVQDKPKRRAIPIQKTSKGALHWPNYAAIARTEIGKLESFADANDWEAVNSPTYLKSGAARISIDNALATRRRELEGGGTAPTPGDAPLDDSEVLNIITIQMSTMTTEDEITKWSKGEQVKAMMFGLRDRSQEKFKQALAIIDDRRLVLAPPL